MFYRALLIITIMITIPIAAIAQESSLAGNAENGKKLFATYFCWSCHGSNGRAGGTAASPGGRQPTQPICAIS